VNHTTGFKGVVICDNCRGYYAHWIYRKTTIGNGVRKEKTKELKKL